MKNPRVKQAAKLRERRHRDKLGRFLIDGQREIGRAVQAGISIEELFVCPSLLPQEVGQPLVDQCAVSGTRVLEVTPQVFERVAFGDRAEGLLAVAATPQRTLGDLQVGETPLIAVLEGVEKPGNVGAVLRSADAAGVDAVIVVDGATDLYNPNAVRASLGAIFTVPVVAAGSHEAATWLREQAVNVFAARVEGAVPYDQFDYNVPAAIVLGSEVAGLSGIWRSPDVTAIRLPMRGAVDSLNVAAAAAVLFYEVLRQRATSPA